MEEGVLWRLVKRRKVEEMKRNEAKRGETRSGEPRPAGAGGGRRGRRTARPNDRLVRLADGGAELGILSTAGDGGADEVDRSS